MSADTPPPFTIRPFKASDQADFARLNLRWIEAYFGVEEEDRKQLEQPEETILADGGVIAVAEKDGAVVGTGALLVAAHQPNGARTRGEIVKMATDPEAQGMGVGSAVLDYLITQARELGMESLWLETNNRLEAATALYQRKGFRTLSPEELRDTPYSRCNLQMVLEL